VGTVGFIGDVNGLMYLYLDVPSPSSAPAASSGSPRPSWTARRRGVVNDAVAELTNMSVGVFKNSLCDAGYPCKLTIPSILRGSSFRIVPTGSARPPHLPFRLPGPPGRHGHPNEIRRLSR
jgi:chemotaxis protein CheX